MRMYGVSCARAVSRWVLMLAFLSAAAACSKGAGQLELPDDERKVPAFPPTAQLDAPAQAKELTEVSPLRIVRSSPDRSGTWSGVLTVVFSEDMRPGSFGQPDREGPLTISPEIKGAFSWWGRRTLVFKPDAALTPGSTYNVTIPTSATALNGARLEKPHKLTIRTPGLGRPSIYVAPYGALTPESAFHVDFNMPVDRSQAQAHIKVVSNGKIVPATIAARMEGPKGKEVASERRYVVKPEQPLPLKSDFKLIVEGAIKPKGGQKTLGINTERSFKTPGDLLVTSVRCGYSNKCNVYDTIELQFTNTVDKESIARCISISPRAELDVRYAYNNRVGVSPKGWASGKTYTVNVNGRCKDKYGSELLNSMSQTFTVADQYPLLTMERREVTLEPGTTKLFPVRARNIESAQLRMAHVKLDRLPHFLERLSKGWDAQDPFVGSNGPDVERSLNLKGKRNVLESKFVDLDEVLKKAPTGLVYMDLELNNSGAAKKSSASQRVENWALVSVTDLGMTIKASPEQTLVWVTSLSNTKAQRGVEVIAYNKQGKELWRKTSDVQGLVNAPGFNIHSGDGKDTPYFLVARRADELALLSLGSYQSRMDPYQFGLPMSWDTPTGAKVVGTIFTERGVYRPADKVYVKGMMRSLSSAGLSQVDAEKITISVTDPRGKVILTRISTLSELGGFDFELDLKQNASLGSYLIKARPVGEQFGELSAMSSGSFRVEAYRAPRFEVKVDAPAQPLELGQKAELAIKGDYLFGAPMKDAKYSVYVDMEPGRFSARDFPRLSFNASPESWYWWDDDGDYASRGRVGVSSQNGNLEDGVATVAVDLTKDFKRQGPQTLLVEASVTDVDGQLITSSKRLDVHPAQFYVGVGTPGTLIEAGKAFEVPIVAVDHAGKPVSGKALKLVVSRREWVSVKKKVAGGGESWVTEPQVKEVASCEKTSAQAPVPCPLTVEQGGSYTLEVSAKDALGRTTMAKNYFYVWKSDGGAWWPQRDDAIIQLISDKSEYKPGDVARIMVQSPFNEAKALVTVEREGIISEQIMELKGQTPTIELPITDKMMPNAFVSVALIRGRVKVTGKDRGPGRAEVDPGKPSFKMGYARLKIDNSSQQLDVAVTTDLERYRPGQEAEVTVNLKDATGKAVKGEVTLMVVDEGVLSLTGYKTPNPFNLFYRERELAVTSFESRMRLLSKVDAKGNKAEDGGDGDGAEGMNFRSKFATTALFLPTLKVGADGQAKTRFKLPEGLTGYRVMAVAAGAKDRFGAAERRLTVSLPLMVRAALPRFASTGDTFKMRAVVQSTGEFAGDVDVVASSVGAVQLNGERSRKVKLSAGQAVTVAFDALALDPGEATVRFSIKAEGMEDAQEVKLPVRYPAAQRQTLMSGMLTNDQPTLWRRLALPETMYQGAGELEVELSSSAYGELVPGLEYLIGYPYGCIEQTTGRALPLVALQDALKGYDLPALPSQKVPEFVQSGADRLLSMQTRSGGLGYWPGDDEAHPWGSAYGGLALVLAKKRGYEVNEVGYKRLMIYLDRVMRGKERQRDYWSSESMLATSTMAAYTLAEAGQSDASYHEFLYNQRQRLPRWAKGLLLMAINRQKKGGALTNRHDQMLATLLEEMTKGITVNSGEATLGDEGDDGYWMTMSSEVRSNSIALMAMLEVAPQDELVGQLARGLLMARQGGHWVSTQSNAFAILALARYFDTVERFDPNYDVTVGFGERVLASEAFSGRQLVGKRVSIPMATLAKNQGKILTLMRRGEGGPLYYTLKLKFHDAKPAAQEVQSGFGFKREYLYADGPNRDKPVGELKVGDIVKVRLTLVVPEERRYVAVEDPLPSGLEPINTSFNTTGRRTAALLNEGGDRDDWWWDYWWYYPRFDHIEQRDDRVLLFADRLTPNVYSHSYLLRATTPGSFMAPAGRVEEMYHPNVFGTTQAAQIVVR